MSSKTLPYSLINKEIRAVLLYERIINVITCPAEFAIRQE